MSALETATTWLQNGMAVIPCLARSKSPALDSWREYQERLPTMRELERWFARPGYNLAVITGWRGLAVIDFDDLGVYSAWIAGLDGLAGEALTTYQVRTRRGVHLYFYIDEPAHNAHGDGWDVKAAGGYVLAPPSVHPSGHVYEARGWIENIQRVHCVGDLLPTYPPYTPQASPAAPERAEAEMDAFDRAMMGGDLHDTGAISAIKARMQPEDILTIAYKRGRVLWARCPAHDDEHPSLAIYPDGHVYCFACGFHGDVVDVYAAIHKIPLPAAILALESQHVVP